MSQLQTQQRPDTLERAATAGRAIVDEARAATQTATAAVDIVETAEAVILYADLPGVKKDDLSVEVKDGEVVRVRGTRHKDDLFYAEDVVYERAFHLPPGVDIDAIAAELKHGVLTLTLPKAAEQKPRIIPVQTA